MLTTARSVSVKSLAQRSLLLVAMVTRNLFSRRPIVGESPVVVSLTSYGARTSTVHLTVESIGRGELKPARVILWLDSADEMREAARRRPIIRLQKRGLELMVSEKIGPHSKYYPYVLSATSHQLPLVTADDDILYPRTWLSRLYGAYKSDPRSIHCYRAHTVSFAQGELIPYMEWPPVETKMPRHSSFLTGVSGVIYPPEFLDFLHASGKAFLQSAPKADDVWINSRAVIAGFRVAQIENSPVHFPVTIGTQREALWRHNADGNDIQIRQTYTDEVRNKVLREIAE